MKKLTILAVLFLSVVLFSCNNAESNENDENSDSTKIENIEDIENGENTEVVEDVSVNSETTIIKVKFEMVYLATDGAWYSFVDENEKDYSFFDDGNQQVRDMFSDVKPNAYADQYANIWFEVEYQTQTLKHYDGSIAEYVNRDVEVITSIKKISDNSTSSTSGITFEDVIATTFGGTEPFWSIKFTQANAKYTACIGNPEITLVYEVKEPNGNSFSITANDHENMETYFITIKKETCTDGMSDNLYPYSIEIKTDGIQYGCGWVL